MSQTVVWSSVWMMTCHPKCNTSSLPYPQANSLHLHLPRPPRIPLLSTRRRFCVQATTQINSSGSIDSPLIQSMHNKIKEHLSAESVIVKDAYGDGRHVSIDVISSAFEGKSSVNRQRMVYKAIWEELQNTVHAVDQMTTKTPTEAGIKNQ